MPGREVAILMAVNPLQIRFVIRAPTRPSLIGSPASPLFSTSVSAGDNPTCAVTSSGTMKCWGIDHGNSGDSGQVTDTP